jgi:hypothetical protein
MGSTGTVTGQAPASGPGPGNSSGPAPPRRAGSPAAPAAAAVGGLGRPLTGTAGGRGKGSVLSGAAVVCRHCREAVTVQGDPQWGRAVHTVTGKETGPGGHVAAPIETSLLQAAAALKAGAAR